ncbi:MAG: hypothetical protein ACRCYT_03455 [Cetobacterium sp.]
MGIKDLIIPALITFICRNLYLQFVIKNLKRELETTLKYNKTTQKSICWYKEKLFTAAFEKNDIELYNEVQTYSEERRKEFLEILEGE